MLPWIEVHTQLVDVRCNIPASGVGCQSRLLEAEEGCREGGDSLFLKLATRLEALPGSRDLDADAAGVEVRGDLLEMGDDPWWFSVRGGVRKASSSVNLRSAFFIVLGVEYESTGLVWTCK
jgi:hypothetical protein